MAEFSGLFTSPADIQNERLKALTAQQDAIKGMGGSMSGLLGQVAAGSGGILSEGINRLAGLRSPEEVKAGQMQDMAGQYDLNTSAGLAAFAKALNDNGMTKEAVMVLEKHNQVLRMEQEQADRSRQIAQGKTRTITDTVMRPMSIGSGKDAQVVMVPTQVQYTEVWNEEKKKWERVGSGVAQGAGDGSASPYGGITIIDPKTGMATMTQGDPAVDGYEEDLIVSP